jgi:hypothetical protein
MCSRVADVLKTLKFSKILAPASSISGSYYKNLYMMNYLRLRVTSLKTRIHRINGAETTNLS